MTARLAVMLSGRGSNFLALQAAVERGDLPAEIVLVLSDVATAAGLAAARRLGLPAVAVPRRGEPSRRAYEEKVLAALSEARPDWICLAGWMRLLSPELVGRWPRRIVNVHPSLLPAFPGLEAQRQALEHGVKVSGCTVHIVDEGLDSGPIVVQRAVEVAEGDDEAALAARILEQEHLAYPEALGRLLREPWRVEGRRLVFGAATGGGRPRGVNDGGTGTRGSMDYRSREGG
jgi:phosphoribosylglycinamide formyltransferase 1